MKMLLYVLLCAFVGSVITGRASGATLSGSVRDEHHAPLPYVNVVLPALHQSCITDDDGKFAFDNLSPTVYTVEISMVGYKTAVRTVNLSRDDITLNVDLAPSPLELPGITVTAKPQPTDALSSSQSVSVMKGRQLDRNRGQSVMDAIAETPGVSLYSTGSGIAKPVIRGLTSQRVLVVSDGVRQEGQQWGDEHGPEIDLFNIDRIEVLRGPSSVLYGSDALGGVVNLLPPEVPAEASGVPVLGGKLMLNGFSNSRQGAGALSLYGANGSLGYRGDLSVRNAGDTTTPGGTLSNSGFSEVNGSAMLGSKGSWGTFFADYSHFGERLEIHEDPAEEPDFTGYQRIQHDKIHMHGDFPTSNLRLEMDGGFQRNHRREFEEGDAVDPGLDLRLDTVTLDVKGHHNPMGPVFGTVGFSLLDQKNETLGEEPLIPAFNQWNFAGFLYEELLLDQVTLSSGLRFDSRHLNVDDNEDLGVAAQTRSYKTFTGTVGASYRPVSPLAFAVNIGRGWRSPTAFELFIDGVHEGTARYEIGDAQLAPEVSLNTDFSIRYATNRVNGEFSVFRNRINDYIFASPTGEIDPESGFRKFQNKQADATLIGAEFSLQGQLLDWLVVNGGVDYVHGTNDETNAPLGLIPPRRIKLGLRLTQPSWQGIVTPYLAINSAFVAAQNRVEPLETPSPAYHLFDLSLGGEIPFGSRRATVDIGVQNIFDQAYRDHLSRYKDYADNPGRDVTAKITLPFDIAP